MYPGSLESRINENPFVPDVDHAIMAVCRVRFPGIDAWPSIFGEIVNLKEKGDPGSL
jgi:hypothetical protein